MTTSILIAALLLQAPGTTEPSARPHAQQSDLLIELRDVSEKWSAHSPVTATVNVTRPRSSQPEPVQCMIVLQPVTGERLGGFYSPVSILTGEFVAIEGRAAHLPWGSRTLRLKPLRLRWQRLVYSTWPRDELLDVVPEGEYMMQVFVHSASGQEWTSNAKTVTVAGSRVQKDPRE